MTTTEQALVRDVEAAIDQLVDLAVTVPPREGRRAMERAHERVQAAIERLEREARP